MPPTMLLNALETVRRRVKLLGVLYGVGIVLAGAVGLLLAIVLLDYIIHLPAVARLVFLIGAISAVAYAVHRWVIAPMLARLTISDVAGRLEQAFPQFDDRLRSTVNFVNSSNPGSDVMQQRVVGETTDLASRLDLGSAVVAKPAWYSLAAGGGAILLMLLLGLLAPNNASIALSRLFAPFGDQQWPKRVQMELSNTVPQRVPVGQRIDVQMKLKRGDSSSRKASIFYQYDNGPVQHELMQRGRDGTYAASLDARVETGKPAANLRIWMQAGDDELQLVPITVVPRLSIRGVEAEITPPPYVTGVGPSVVNLMAAPALAADGSTIALRLTFSKPLAQNGGVQIVPASDEMKLPEGITWTSDTQATVTGKWLASESLRFHVRATDVDGFTNSGLEEYEVIVRPDQNPAVQIENPRRNEERTVNSVVPLVGLADDDYGLQSVKLVVERAADQKRWEIELLSNGQAVNGAVAARAEGAADRIRMRINYPWDLAQLKEANLKAGDVLEYHLAARDNYALNGQTHDEVVSGRLRLAIITEQELEAKVIEELRQVKNQVQGVKTAIDRTRQETVGLAEDTKQREKLDPADLTAIERLTNQQATSTSQTKQIAGRVEQLRERLNENKVTSQELSELARNVAGDLQRAAENPMRQATNELSTAGRQNGENQPQQNQENQPAGDPSTQQRKEALARATESQQQASGELQRALDRMNNIGSLQETMSQLRKLLEDQQKVARETREIGRENLGKKPEQMKPEDRQRLEQVADQQARLAEQTAKALEEMQKQGQQMQKSDPSSAEAMQRAAQTGKQQQTTENQQKASQQARQNQQAQAQAAQRQAEIGLELMLNSLRDAERHKLAELQKKLEELSRQVEILIRRQAGHNLDNIAVQGAARLAQIEKAKLEELLRQAERDPERQPPAPEVTQLSGPQEQTERNTRDLSKTAEEMPDSAEVASRLSRASSRMERAAVNLRDRKLPDAYDPSQVEALAELVAAGKQIDQQQKKVDEQIEEQKKDAIRQRYVKVREEQQKLNDETKRIDAARNPEGALGRADAVRLGQLPGEEGKLADAVAGIGEDLASVGSTVYVWANKDIVQSMNDVKQDLGKQTTGAATRAEQQRIVDQLDAMIRNLATKPKESEFAQDAGGGGGGGGGGEQMPPEAELRLMQDLQRAVNQSTKVIDEQPDKDREKLLALGNRQGELRKVLDEALQNASQGKAKLGPEPDSINQLPEEAKVEDVEAQELDQNLLNGEPDAAPDQQKTNLIGDRMARSRQRLAISSDPGKITQEIQKRIIDDFDLLIDQARQQQGQTRNPPPQGQGQRMAQAGQNPGQPQNQGQQPGQQNQGNAPANDSNAPGQGAVNEDLTKSIEDRREDWGEIAPRLREAIVDSAGEKIPEDYRKLVEEYYRSVGSRSTGR